MALTFYTLHPLIIQPEENRSSYRTHNVYTPLKFEKHRFSPNISYCYLLSFNSSPHLSCDFNDSLAASWLITCLTKRKDFPVLLYLLDFPKDLEFSLHDAAL